IRYKKNAPLRTFSEEDVIKTRFILNLYRRNLLSESKFSQSKKFDDAKLTDFFNPENFGRIFFNFCNWLASGDPIRWDIAS
ncbi:MAG: hypothetical protein ACKOCO_18600, partial [Bacteroidota bacterium]